MRHPRWRRRARAALTGTHVPTLNQPIRPEVDRGGRPRSQAARTRRWVNAWLIAAALLAVLLVANSVRDYVRVWRILAIQQVRHQIAQYVVDLEQRLRRSPTPTLLSSEVLTSESGPTLDDALWIEVRSPDGAVLARRGEGGGPAAGRSPFSRP